MAINAEGKFDSYNFLFQYLNEAYQILICSYFELLKSDQDLINDNENTLRDKLIEIAENKKLSLSFEWDTESRNIKAENRIDITIIYQLGLGFEKRLGIECKLMKNGVENYIDNNGIISFITGKYSSEMPIAGMIGFINGMDINTCVKSINSSLKNHKTIKTDYYLAFFEILKGHQNSYHSNHKRQKGLNNIALYHLLFEIKLAN